MRRKGAKQFNGTRKGFSAGTPASGGGACGICILNMAIFSLAQQLWEKRSSEGNILGQGKGLVPSGEVFIAVLGFIDCVFFLLMH